MQVALRVTDTHHEVQELDHLPSRLVVVQRCRGNTLWEWEFELLGQPDRAGMPEYALKARRVLDRN